MEYILSALLLALNLFNYEYRLNALVFFVVGAAIFTGLFAVCMKKTGNFLAVCLMMFCYTWSTSWINVFGASTSELQLPWFYIIGAFVVLYAVLNFKMVLKNSYGAVTLTAFIVFFVIFNLPLLNSASFAEGLKEYIMIGFFAVVLFAAFLFRDSIPPEAHLAIKKAFIWSVFLTSVGIILQWVVFKLSGIALFKLGTSLSFSGDSQTSCGLLLEDTSSSTIMLGCAVFYIFDLMSRKTARFLVPALIITLAALAMTSRRTSVVSLMIILFIYCMVHYRGVGKKIAMLFVFAMCAGILLYYLLQSRPMDSLIQIVDENGRFVSYTGALRILFENPLGVGYDNAYLASMMPRGIVTHNTVLRWLNMGGYFFTAVFLVLVISPVIASVKKKLNAEFWILIYTLFASNLIPDILNARFFIIICALAFMAEESHLKAEEGPLNEGAGSNV